MRGPRPEFRAGGPWQGERLSGGDLFWDAELGRGSGTNTWGKLLPDGAWALVFVNNGPNSTDVFCDLACYRPMVVGATHRSYSVRDLWAKQTIGGARPRPRPHETTRT